MSLMTIYIVRKIKYFNNNANVTCITMQIMNEGNEEKKQ